MDLLHLWCIIGVILQRTVNGQQLVSQGKPITSSSLHKTWSADKAVDGDKRPLPDTCDCCAVTENDFEPWFVLDLEQTYMVQRINVIGRTQYQNLREMEIKLGTIREGGTVLTKNTANVDTYDYKLQSPQRGRYITLTLRGISEYFVICELEVYAECSGNTYGDNCAPCGKCLDSDPCNKTDGSCQSCAAGYQGSKCDQPCDQHMYGPGCTNECGECENNVTCNNVNGTCADCKTGYMAPMCKDCSNSYHGNTCNERCYCAVGSCDTSTGVCPAGGCTAGYKGNKCDTLCDSNMWGKDCQVACGNCLNDTQCDVFNGKCTGGCSGGFKGELCTEPCEDGKYGPNCMLNCGNCLNNATCDKQDGRCTSCAAGYKGDKCLETCNRFTYGVDCKEPCGNCSNNVPCNRVNGSCPAGCSAGVKGELCKTPCGNGSYGRDCLMSCGNCLGGETCNAETGICGNGCTEGFNGTFCNMSCPAKTFGRNCVSTCGNCFQGVACRNTNGQCEDGCEPGYKEPTCNIECENGTFGRGCQQCGSCINDEPCDKLNGTCQECALGYSLHNCTLYEGEINSAASRGECPTCNIAMIVGGTLVSILAIEGVAAALFLLIRKRRRYLKKDTINRSNPYELPNRGMNEGEHEYESAMELDINTNAYENTGPTITVRREEK